MFACVFSSSDTVSWLVGANKSYVIATSDLCLFIHASNLLSSLPTPLPYIWKREKIKNLTVASLYSLKQWKDRYFYFSRNCIYFSPQILRRILVTFFYIFYYAQCVSSWKNHNALWFVADSMAYVSNQMQVALLSWLGRFRHDKYSFSESKGFIFQVHKIW